MSYQVTTDHKWKPFRYAYEVPKDVREDYPAEQDGFFKYQRSWYHLSDFMRITEGNALVAGFEGFYSLNAFCAVVIKVSRDGESYKVGKILC